MCYIPAFKHNLLYVRKLCQDMNGKVVFFDNYCTIQDYESHVVKGVGKGECSVYLLNEPVKEILCKIKKQAVGKSGVHRSRVASNASAHSNVLRTLRNAPKVSK